MLGLSKSQLKLLAEMFGNAAVAWFVGGVITPLFLGTENTQIFLLSIMTGILISSVFAFLALNLIEKSKYNRNYE